MTPAEAARAAYIAAQAAHMDDEQIWHQVVEAVCGSILDIHHRKQADMSQNMTQTDRAMFSYKLNRRP